MAKNKMKTRRAVAKRFHVTGSGKIMKNGNTNTSHLALSKEHKRKMHLRKAGELSRADRRRLRRCIAR
ncbi:MAG: 50S ribosomal protein L35 [Bacilli bacterium]|jgi:large subunit ribosomal protein L35|nr:50S ribosomal protein L35 [Bacilli bacterium]